MSNTYTLQETNIIRDDGFFIPIVSNNKDFRLFMTDCVNGGLLTQEQADNNELPSPDNILVFPTPVLPLEQIKTQARRSIDSAAENIRLKYITPGDGQAMTYLKKSLEAKAYKTAGYPADLTGYPYINTEVSVMGVTGQEAADGILTIEAQWEAISIQVELTRLTGKSAVTNASTKTEIENIQQNVINTLNSL